MQKILHIWTLSTQCKCGHITGIFQVLFSRLGAWKVKEFSKMLFVGTFSTFLSSITTETGTEVENYDTCINPSVKLGHDLYYCLYRVRYAKSDQNHVSRPLFKVLWSDSLPAVKTIRYLKSKGNMTLSTYRLFPTNNLIFKG